VTSQEFPYVRLKTAVEYTREVKYVRIISSEGMLIMKVVLQNAERTIQRGSSAGKSRASF
jgi:hypothetical protein